MRFSVLIGAQGETLEQLLEVAEACEAAGLDAVWYGQFLGYDAPTLALAAAGRTERLLPSVSVVTAGPRHPIAVAAQAQTVSLLTGGRYRFALGLSHRSTIEGIFGLEYPPPARYLREYLRVLRGLLDLERVDFDGEFVSAHAQLAIPEAQPMPFYTGALGPLALEATGEFAAGTITYLAGVRTVEEHVLPRLRVGAARSERTGVPVPEVIASVPVLATDDPEAAAARIFDFTRFHAGLPEYHQVIEREGIADASELAIAGDVEALRRGIARFRDVGVAEFGAALLGSLDEELRTIAALGEVAADFR